MKAKDLIEILLKSIEVTGNSEIGVRFYTKANPVIDYEPSMDYARGIADHISHHGTKPEKKEDQYIALPMFKVDPQ